MNPEALTQLRQLKELLDAGTITQSEFDVLKQKLLFPEATPPTAVPPAYAPEPATTFSAPVEDPLLPPIVHTFPAADPALAAGAPTPPTPVPGFTHPLEAGRPGASPTAEAGSYPPAIEPQDEYLPETAEVAPAKSPLATILVIGGIVALLALVAYLMLGNRESERLTSTTLTAADTLAVQPEAGPQAEQIDLPPAAAPETVRVAPVVPVAPVDTANQPATAPTETAPAVPATPDPAVEQAAQARVQSILTSYYADMQAAPFSAATYFAPKVERFYLQQNTTPAAINDELAKSHFPEFLEANSQIEPGTLKIGEPVADGSRVVTFVEKSQAFRQSLQKHQQTSAQVRVRFDKNFKIVYLRQEKLLENNFSD